MNRSSGREENYSGSLFQLFAPESFLEITLYIRKCFASDAFTAILLLSFYDKKFVTRFKIIYLERNIQGKLFLSLFYY